MISNHLAITIEIKEPIVLGFYKSHGMEKKQSKS